MTRQVLNALRQPKPAIALGVVLLVTCAVYWRVVHAYFFGDDFGHLTILEDRAFLDFLVRVQGGHLYLTSKVVLALIYKLFGLTATPYGVLSLVTHLANVALLFRIGLVSTRNALLATLAAALWGTCPVHATVLGWHSAYAQTLSTLMTLVVLERAVVLARSSQSLSLRTAFAWAAVLLVGATCFGTGIAVAALAPVVLAMLIPAPRRERGTLAVFLALPLAVMGLYWLYARFGSTGYYGGLLALAVGSPGNGLRMLCHLLSFGVVALVEGFTFFPRALYPSPAALSLSLLAVVLVIAAAVRASREDRRGMLAFTLLSIGSYAIIALGRASFYAVILGTEPARSAAEPRFHYAAAAPLALVLMLTLAQATRLAPSFSRLPGIVLTAWGAVSAHSFVTTTWAIDEHSDVRHWVESSLREIDKRIDARPPDHDVRIPNRPAPPRVNVAYADFPGWAGLFILTHGKDEVRGRRVRFVDLPGEVGAFSDPAHHRLSRLMVPP